MIELSPISISAAKEYFEKHSAYRGDFTAAIAAKEGDTTHGVVAFEFDGVTFIKRQISTDGNALIGSLLYGGMVRVAMALDTRRSHFEGRNTRRGELSWIGDCALFVAIRC